MWTFLTIFVILFEIWLGAAYMVAYLHTRERLLLVQVIQAVLMTAVFAYISVQIWNQQPLNLALVVVPLGLSVLLSILWRRGVERTNIVRGYPRGIADILTFRRPASDLKRRVRTK